MAAGGNKPMSLEKLEEMVTCSICFEIMKDPQTFSCFHTFCAKCTVKLKPNPGSTGIPCPTCRGVSEPGEVRSNFMMQQLLEVYNESKKEKRCAQCETEDPPQRCNDCKMDLCAACAENHCRVPYLKGHIVAPIDRTARNKVHVDTLIFCPLHKDKLVEFNCRDEERTLCINCKILEHNSHNTEITTECLKRIVPWAKQKVEILESDIEKDREVIENIDKNKQELETNLNKIKEELEQKKKAFIKKIEEDHKKLFEMVEGVHKKDNDRLDKVRENMTIRVDERRNMADWVKISLKTAENASLMHVLQKDVRDRLVKATEGPESKQPRPVIDRAKFTFDARQQLTTSGENALGKINTTQPKTK